MGLFIKVIELIINGKVVKYLFIHDYFSLEVGEYWIQLRFELYHWSYFIKTTSEFVEFHTRTGGSHVYTMSVRKSLTTRQGTLHPVAMWTSLRFVLLGKKATTTLKTFKWLFPSSAFKWRQNCQ